jgi:hypothetical protein
MGAFVELTHSTGHSKCAICGGSIVKGQVQIAFSAYNASARVHRYPVQCKNQENVILPHGDELDQVNLRIDKLEGRVSSLEINTGNY